MEIESSLVLVVKNIETGESISGCLSLDIILLSSNLKQVTKYIQSEIEYYKEALETIQNEEKS